MKAPAPRLLATYLLVFLGLSQPIGWAAGLSFVRGLGIVSAASPLPFVFSSFRGVETFAAAFTIELVRPSGERIRHVVTPQLYAALDGPYNRRNTYGAVLAYGPALDAPEERALVDSVLRHGLCDDGPLARRFGGSMEVTRVAVEVRPTGRAGGPVFRRELPCSD